jgi:hypothetical protein
MIVPEEIDDKMPRGCGCLTVVAIIFIVIVCIWTCNSLMFSCYKTHYSEGIHVCFKGNIPKGMRFTVLPIQTTSSWLPIVLDSNQCYDTVYYGEALGSCDVPSIEIMQQRIVVITADNSNEIRLTPDTVTNIHGDYTLSAREISIERKNDSVQYTFRNEYNSKRN